MFFFLVATATESLYSPGPIVEKVLKQALWELGGHQALAFKVIHGGAAIATGSETTKNGEEWKMCLSYGFRKMEQSAVEQAIELFRPIAAFLATANPKVRI